MTVSDADRAKAAEVEQQWEREAERRLDALVKVRAERDSLRAAIAEARAPGEQLAASVREMAEEVDRPLDWVRFPDGAPMRACFSGAAVAFRLRKLLAAAEETSGGATPDVDLSTRGALVEIIDRNANSGSALLPTRIRVNGVDVGYYEAGSLHVDPGGKSTPAKVSFTLLPARIVIRGADE